MHARSCLAKNTRPKSAPSSDSRYGLGDNIAVQFGRYLVTLGQGDFGNSIRTGRPVTTTLSERLPMTLELTVGAMLFASTLGILLGIISALRHNTGADVATMVGANVGVSMPVFWLGLMLAYLFAVLLKGTPFWLPPSPRLTAGVSMMPLDQLWHLQNMNGLTAFLVGLISNSVVLHSLLIGRLDITWDAIRHLILPSLAVGTIPLAIIARLTRSQSPGCFRTGLYSHCQGKGFARANGFNSSRHAKCTGANYYGGWFASRGTFGRSGPDRNCILAARHRHAVW